jgi:hypothetical protein
VFLLGQPGGSESTFQVVSYIDALQTRPTTFLANLLFFNAFFAVLRKYHMYVIKAKFCHFEEKFAKIIPGTDYLANFRLGSDLDKKYRIHNTVLLVPTVWSILFGCR